MDTKTCETCGKEFSRPRPLSKTQWENRRFCSRKCFGITTSERQRRLDDRTCPICGTVFRPYSRRTIYCSWECASKRPRGHGSERGRSWKGGRVMHGDYIRINDPSRPFWSEMVGKHRYVFEHRLVMAEHVGRALLPSETVHHLNGDHADNRIENLELRIGRHGRGASRAHCTTCTCFE